MNLKDILLAWFGLFMTLFTLVLLRPLINHARREPYAFTAGLAIVITLLAIAIPVATQVKQFLHRKGLCRDAGNMHCSLKKIKQMQSMIDYHERENREINTRDAKLAEWYRKHVY